MTLAQTTATRFKFNQKRIEQLPPHPIGANLSARLTLLCVHHLNDSDRKGL